MITNAITNKKIAASESQSEAAKGEVSKINSPCLFYITFLKKSNLGGKYLENNI